MTQMRSSIPLYDALAADYDAHFEVPHRWAYDELSWRAVVDRLEVPRPGCPVVDAGCGVGRWAERLVGLGHEVIGVEQSPRMVEAARSRGLGASFTVVEGSMEQVELSHDVAAAAVAMGSLQYSLDPVATLERLGGWIRPGGLVAVLVDSLGSLVVELCRAGREGEAEQRRTTRSGVWVAEGRSADLHLFDAASLRCSMEAAGLIEVEVRGLLCGWTIVGREQLMADLSSRSEESLAREERWSRDPALVDMGKQLLGLARVPG